MPPLSRPLIALSRSLLPAEVPLISRTPIGRIAQGEAAGQRFFGSFHRSTQKQAGAKGWATNPPVRTGGSRRFQSTWEKQHGSPKRSNTAPLLGAALGATALAYVGSTFASQQTEEDENPIKSEDSIDLTDAEGWLFSTSSHPDKNEH